jgi:hypothetical protein
MTPARTRLPPPTSVTDVIAWLESMPAVQRERVARVLTDPQSVKEIGLCRARAVQEMTKEPGASWASVAATIGASEATVNRLVTAARKADASPKE